MAVFPMPPAPTSVIDSGSSTKSSRSSTMTSRPKKFTGARGRGGGGERKAASSILAASEVVVDGLASEALYLSGWIGRIGIIRASLLTLAIVNE